ncbi:MAG: helix-turn-helix transcriptional regulator [Leptolyngbyaceae cyanobacterium SM2_5_2]|nr:helix-turn-helix transcriptional regulator [Leptolyngbyaceae cyanobacterium SM2_5_2]
MEDIWNISPNTTVFVKEANFSEACHTLRHAFFGGQWQEIRTPDFWLNIHHLYFTEELVIKAPTASWGPVSSFFIIGTVINQHLGLTEENLEAPGQHYLECIQDGCEVDHFFTDAPVIRLRFALSPQFIQRLTAAFHVPADLKPLIETGIASSFYSQGKTTPEMHGVLGQILKCPYQGFLKQLYLEGKILELSTLQFAQFAGSSYSQPCPITLRTDDIERIYQAREILICQYSHPPSLLELARQVGLNDFKLKQGFRHVFGTTVFGFLREFRLEQAQTLLSNGQLTVQQVAHVVGYSHTGYFAKAFKRNMELVQRLISSVGVKWLSRVLENWA